MKMKGGTEWKVNGACVVYDYLCACFTLGQILHDTVIPQATASLSCVSVFWGSSLDLILGLDPYVTLVL